MAYADKLANYNNGVKYLLVAVDVLSRKLRAQPMKTKGEDETDKTFGRLITKTKPLKVWSDKGTEFIGAGKSSVKAKTLTLTPETVKRNLLLQSAIFDVSKASSTVYKHLEDK